MGNAVAPDRDKPVPFYYDLQLALTADRVWVELSARHPIHGRSIWDSWGALRPSGPTTEAWVLNTMWEAVLEATRRSDDRR